MKCQKNGDREHQRTRWTRWATGYVDPVAQGHARSAVFLLRELHIDRDTNLIHLFLSVEHVITVQERMCAYVCLCTSLRSLPCTLLCLVFVSWLVFLG